MVEDSYDNCQAETVNTVYPDCLFKHTSKTLSTVTHQSQSFTQDTEKVRQKSQMTTKAPWTLKKIFNSKQFCHMAKKKKKNVIT